MNNTLMRYLLLSLLLPAIQFSVKAYDFCLDGIFYNITNETGATVEVTHDGKSNSYSGDIVIPSHVKYEGKEYTVTRIGSNSFDRCSELTSLILPETLTSLARGAIILCPLIKEINIPESVAEIGSGAFCGNKSIKRITLPVGLTVISDWLFDGCESLEYVDMPPKIKSIGKGAFQYCYSLKSIKISDYLTSISEYAFYCCHSLESFVIPDGVTSIESGVFGRCTSLKEVKMGSRIEELGKFAFSDCTSLEKFVCLTVTPPNCDTTYEASFAGVNVEDITLYVPDGTRQNYNNNVPWNKFGAIVEVAPMPEIVSIDNVVKQKVDDSCFKFKCSVKCKNAKNMTVEVEEDYSHTLRNYWYANPDVVEVETGNISSLYNSYVTITAFNESGSTQKVFEYSPELPDGLYYAGTDGYIYLIDNDGNKTTLNTDVLPHTFQLLKIGDRIYGTSAGTAFTYNSTPESSGDGKLFYLVNQNNQEILTNVVLDNTGGNHNLDPYGLASYKDDIYVYDRNETVRKLSYSDIKVPQDYPAWLKNWWIDFYGNGWSYGCIKSDLQITEVCDGNGKAEPVFWLMMNYGGSALYRFKTEAIQYPIGTGDTSYNKALLRGIKSTAFYLDEANDHIYVYKELGYESGLYRGKISDMLKGTYTPVELIDGSPIREEGSASEPVAISQLSVDNNGEYLYWCYRAPTSNDDYNSSLWNNNYNPANPLHHTGIKRIKLGQTSPKVEIIAEGADGYGVVALNYTGRGQNSITDIPDDTYADTPVEYFNLQGIRILNPQAGTIVIRRQGNKVTKIRY